MRTLEQPWTPEAPPVGEERMPVPKAPETIEETGLSESQIISLLLKTLYQQGALLGSELAAAMALPFVVLDDVLLTVTHRHFVEVLGTSGHSRAGYRFELTDEGRRRAEAAFAAGGYVGPAPVPLHDFKRWTDLQSVRDTRVSREVLETAFHDLVLSELKVG